jgi:integrase
MALKPTKRKDSPYYQITGSIKGYGRVRESTGLVKLADAKVFAAALEQEIRASLKTGEGRTFSDAIIAYVEHTGNRQYLNKINAAIGKVPLEEIGQEVIDRGARDAYPSYRRGKKGKLRQHSKATIRRQFYAPVAAILHYAHDLKWIPYVRVKLPKTKRPAPKWADKEWFSRLFEHASDRLKAICIFLAGTGCRISEALNLEAKDVNILRKTAMVRTTKNGEPREVYLPGFVIEAITPFLESPKIFPYKTRFEVNADLERTCAKAGIEYLSTHKVGSHTFATNLAQKKNMDAKALTATGRWKDPKSTYHYTHYLKREESEKAEVLGELFD